MSQRTRSAPPDLPGFSYEDNIGGGGFADVFLYTQHRPNRKVAVKVLRAEHLNEDTLVQFETEADVMAEVSEHPYIVSVYTAGVAPDGRPYIVMEHYPQPHFGVRARGGKLAVSEVLRVGVQICSAVETAHEASILHRDIKPANILTSAFGRPGLTDFGISGVRREGVVEAASGVTVPFAPPEVLLDESASGSELSDVYSVGATVYALLAGRPPHWVPGGQNDDGSLISRIAKGPPPATGRDDTGPLEFLLAGVMATDPTHRPRSALALAQSLQDIEHELRLAPTPIEVRGDLREIHEIDRSDADGTRRPPQVVDPDGGQHTGPRRSAPPAVTPPDVSTTRARGSAAPAGTAPVAGLAGGSSSGSLALQPQPSGPTSTVGDDTIMRSGGRIAAPDDVLRSAEGEEPASPATDAGLRMPPMPVLVGVGVGALLLVVLMVYAITSGSQAQQAERDQQTTEPEPDLGPAVPATIDEPTELEATWDPASEALTVRWEPPPQAEQYPMVYRVQAIDPTTHQPLRHDDPLDAAFREHGWDLDQTEMTLEELAVGPDGPPCVQVTAVGPQMRGSDPSMVACPVTADGSEETEP